jgi:hypothetical protein
VVGGADDQGWLADAPVVEGVQDGPDALVERADARLEGSHVLAHGGGVGQVGRRERVRVSRTEVGAAKLRCVSKKPTERNQGSGSDAMASTARGVTSDAWSDGTSTTSS